MNPVHKQIQKAINEIENLYPPDNLIETYDDFLQTRESLTSYQFNPNLFGSLVLLTCNLWNTNKRINRLSLISHIKRYATIRHEKFRYKPLVQCEYYDYPDKICRNIFWLFKESFLKTDKLSLHCQHEVQRKCNSLLINKVLLPKEVNWLCDNGSYSELILNRILRYTIPNRKITNWVKQNFEIDNFRHRRS